MCEEPIKLETFQLRQATDIAEDVLKDPRRALKKYGAVKLLNVLYTLKNYANKSGEDYGKCF